MLKFTFFRTRFIITPGHIKIHMKNIQNIVFNKIVTLDIVAPSNAPVYAPWGLIHPPVIFIAKNCQVGKSNKKNFFLFLKPAIPQNPLNFKIKNDNIK